MLDEDMEIYYGSRGEDFQNMIKNILKKANLKEHYVNILLTDENLKEYGNAFTSDSADPINNYQIYEKLGDLSAIHDSANQSCFIQDRQLFNPNTQEIEE